MKRIPFALVASALACGVEPQRDLVVTAPTATPPVQLAQPPRAEPAPLSAKPRGVTAPTTVERVEESKISLPRTITMPGVGPMARLGVANAVTTGGGSTSGLATFVGAPVVDPDAHAIPGFGAGSYDLTVSAVPYIEANASSFAYTTQAESPTGAIVDYLVLGAGSAWIDPTSGAEIASTLYVVVPSADFAPGATVAFDGVDRLAVFLHGDVSLEPTVAAVADIGSVSFTAGGLALGALVDATLSADFVEIQLQAPAPSPSPPPTPVGPAANITAGAYTLAYSPVAYVYCDGALIGQEQAFAGLLPSDVGLGDGQVTLAIAGDAIDLSGALGFGPSLLLSSDIDAPPGVYYGVVNAIGAGPLQTELVGAYFAVDDVSATPQSIAAFAGVAFVDAVGDGFCQVDFEAQLAP